MKAIILAAGYGNRMRPLTDTIHKTLLKVGGIPIIERIINGLMENDIRDIVVVTGYRADDLKSHLLGRYDSVNFTFVHNSRYRETNNIYSMALAFEQAAITDDVVLIESDLIYDPFVIQRLLSSRYDNVALLGKYRSGMDGTVVAVSDGVISQVIPTHLQGTDFNFSDKYKTLNIYKFSKDFCNNLFKKLLTYYAKVIDDNCYYELILGILIYMQQDRIHAEVIDDEKWAEVDDPNDLRVAEFIFNKDQRLKILQDEFGGCWSHDVLDFCFIRNMYFPTPSMFSEMRANLPNLLQNYGSRQEVLNQKMAYFLRCNKGRVNTLNGASQIYPMLKNFFQGRKVLIPQPTFGEYPRIFKSHDTYGDKVGINMEELAEKTMRADLVVIVNPNNPTGSTLGTEQIFDLVRLNPQKMFIIDESFIEFSGQKSMLEFLEMGPVGNAIVIKSLSKSLGMPGIRIGYVYSCNEEFNNFVRAELPIWNLNSMSEFMLEIILKQRKFLDQSYVDTIRDREEFANLLSKLDFVKRVYPSGGDYVLISFDAERTRGKDLAGEMLRKFSIYVKDVSERFEDGKCYLRLAVRLPSENLRLVESLGKIYSESAVRS